jgi:hypothetical protein
MEDPETITTTRVSMIVNKFANPLIFRADICVGMWTDSVNLKIIPITVSIRATTPVIIKVVIWTCDPVASWRLIRIEQGPTSLGHNDTVMLDYVLLLDCVFYKDDMTLDVIANIVDESQIMSAMKRESSIEALMRAKTFAV